MPILTSRAIQNRDEVPVQCCGDSQRFYWLVMGARKKGEGEVERFIHRHYPDGFVLPVHDDCVPK